MYRDMYVCICSNCLDAYVCICMCIYTHTHICLCTVLALCCSLGMCVIMFEYYCYVYHHCLLLVVVVVGGSSITMVTLTASCNSHVHECTNPPASRRLGDHDVILMRRRGRLIHYDKTNNTT